MNHRLPLAFAVGALVLATGSVARGAEAASPPVAILLDASGPVTVGAPGGGAFHLGRPGEPLPAGARVRTGPRGEAHMRWRNGGDFRLMPLGELELTHPNDARLNTGRVWARFQQKLLAPFLFNSPSATAVVRGTTLGVAVDGAGSTRVAVVEGHVEVSGLAGGPHVMVGPGQALGVTRAGRLSPLGPLAPDERKMPGATAAASPGKGQANPQGAEGQKPDQGQKAARSQGKEGTESRDRASDRAAARANERAQRRFNVPWRRLDDWTRSGTQWLDRQRAAERLPVIHQQQIERDRGNNPGGGKGPGGPAADGTPHGNAGGNPAGGSDGNKQNGSTGGGGDAASNRSAGGPPAGKAANPTPAPAVPGGGNGKGGPGGGNGSTPGGSGPGGTGSNVNTSPAGGKGPGDHG